MKILIDSSSIDNYLSTSSRKSQSFFKYVNSEYLELTRTPCDVQSPDLERIVPFEKEYRNESLFAIKIVTKRYEQTTERRTAFRYRKSDIEEIAKTVLNKQELSAEELDLVELVFIQATLKRHDEPSFLVTANSRLLKNRLWFEGHAPGGDLNIMTLEEAVEIVDLHLKTMGKFHISTNYTTNKGLWYWLSFRTKVPFFNVGDPIIDAFSKRFIFSLMSVDEIGFQYYSGVNNDTMDNAIYHFNYLILLISGIFDSLAIRTFSQYKLGFNGSNNPCRISLQNDLGKGFLKALREKNPAIRKHVNDYVHFIKVIYLLRDTILHREGLESPCFEDRNLDHPWRANFIEVPNETTNLLKQCGDEKEDYEPWTKFGIYPFQGKIYLEPFKFAKGSILLLASFCNEFLRLLGFQNFIDTIKKKDQDDFKQTVEVFEKDNIGL